MTHPGKVKLEERTQEASQADLRKADFSEEPYFPFGDQQYEGRHPASEGSQG